VRSGGVRTTRAFAVLGLSAILIASCTAQAAPRASQSPAPGGRSGSSATVGGSWKTIRVPATAVAGDHREVRVYTPDVARPDQLPVLYLLHGEPGGASDLCNPSVGDSLAAASASGVQPFVVACPDGNDDDFDDTEWADSVDGRSQVEAFVTGPLITAVEGAHPRPRGLRAISGFSMGGYGAAMLALRHPNLYGQVATLAGYFTIDDPDGIFGDDPAVESAYNPTDLIALAPRMRWLLIEATNDDLELTAHASESYATLLRARGATVELRRTPGNHDNAWADAQLPAVAQFLAAGWKSG
jgi:S-formylglutathione hydrolase FrmB